MSIYIELTYIALITVFIVDVSGFTDTFLNIATSVKGRRVDEFRPFTCSLCMTWWCCLIWCVIRGEFGLDTICASAGFAAMAYPIGQGITLVRDMAVKIINKISQWMRL